MRSGKTPVKGKKVEWIGTSAEKEKEAGIKWRDVLHKAICCVVCLSEGGGVEEDYFCWGGGGLKRIFPTCTSEIIHTRWAMAASS